MNKPKKIWMVEGVCGYYDDREEWPVAFYYSEAKAKLHIKKLQAEIKELWDDVIRCEACYERDISPECKKHWGKRLKLDKRDTTCFDPLDTRYYCFEVELGEL